MGRLRVMGGLNVAIVGAGIGGLTAAIALDRRGVNVAVYEKAHELKELGAGVVIGANGARVYDSLGLGDSLAAIAGKVSTFRYVRTLDD
jgi:salicylate hydroxylase